jgi:hypothetical protein
MDALSDLLVYRSRRSNTSGVKVTAIMRHRLAPQSSSVASHDPQVHRRRVYRDAAGATVMAVLALPCNAFATSALRLVVVGSVLSAKSAHHRRLAADWSPTSEFGPGNRFCILRPLEAGKTVGGTIFEGALSPEEGSAILASALKLKVPGYPSRTRSKCIRAFLLCGASSLSCRAIHLIIFPYSMFRAFRSVSYLSEMMSLGPCTCHPGAWAFVQTVLAPFDPLRGSGGYVVRIVAGLNFVQSLLQNRKERKSTVLG